MKREKITQNMDMVDSTGVVRHITVTVERDPGIRVGVALVGYFDEDNLYPGLFMHLQGRENTPTKLNYSRDGAIFIRWNGMSCYKRA